MTIDSLREPPRRGPLRGLTVLEIVGIGPGPFCGMMLADLGARVISIERRSAREAPRDAVRRNRRSVALDLKRPEGAEVVRRMCESADALFEGFRPGVAERLGVGPDDCLGRNPRLVYGRVTGWGQEGPLAARAGHDIDFIALAGALHAVGRPGGPPVPPLNLIGDYGGGGMLLAFGIVCALLEAQRTGRGQVVDAAMVDGVAALMAPCHWLADQGWFDGRPGTSILSGEAPFYGVYETADHRWVAVGALEPQFAGRLCELLGIDEELAARAVDREEWEEVSLRLAAVFRRRTRDEWCDLLEDEDVCFAPVLTFDEAPDHRHSRARGAYVEVDGMRQPAPAPRFSATPPDPPSGARRPGEDGEAVLTSFGYDAGEIAALRRAGVLV